MGLSSTRWIPAAKGASHLDIIIKGRVVWCRNANGVAICRDAVKEEIYDRTTACKHCDVLWSQLQSLQQADMALQTPHFFIIPTQPVCRIKSVPVKDDTALP